MTRLKMPPGIRGATVKDVSEALQSVPEALRYAVHAATSRLGMQHEIEQPRRHGISDNDLAAAKAQEAVDIALVPRIREAAIERAHEPQDFGAWRHQRNERDQASLERLEALFKRRDARKVDRQRQLENKAPLPAHMQSGNRSVANPQYREDQDLTLAMQVRQELRDLQRAPN